MYKAFPRFKVHLDILLVALYLMLSCILLVFSTGSFVVSFKTIGFSVMSGAQRGVFSVSRFFTSSVSAIQELSELREKYDALLARLEDYELMQRSNADIRSENERLKQLLDYSESLHTDNIHAEVIGRDPNNLFSAITINRGAMHGVRKNMVAVAFQNGNVGLVGKVVQVGRMNSLIMPLFDYQCFVSVRFDTSRYEGLVNGQGNSDLPIVMKYVKKRARDEIKIGDRISTSGENYLYPRDIPVGFVARIRGLEYETSLDIDIEPVIDFSRLESVFILDTKSLSAEVE